MNDMSSTLRKKLAPSRAAVVPGGSVVEALLRKVMPRSADDELSLDMSVGTVTMELENKSDVLVRLSETDLIYRMEGDGNARGLCVVSAPILAGLIEVQMSGRVTSAPVVERRPTRTDGTVAGDMIDRWIEDSSAVAEAEGCAEGFPIVGYLRATGILDRRESDLTLDPQPYRVLSIELRFGDMAKTGTIVFAVPENPASGAQATRSGPERMRRHLKMIHAPLTAILGRFPQPIERVRNLAVGDVLPVPASALTDVRLEGADGKLISKARLGQLNGNKAVRLTLSAKDLAALGLPVSGGATGGMKDVTNDLDGVGSMVPEVPGVPALDAPLTPLDGADGGGLPDLPDLPGLPDLPREGEPSGVSDLPELPDLPDLPDLPELPDLPPLE